MKFKTLLFATVLLLSAGQTFARASGMLFQPARESQFVINNRVLANINGKAISVIDVMKKMDLVFYQQFPQFAESEEARYQFYKYKWREFLDEMINKELVIHDALENKVPVTNSDVRQEMEEIFGPNIIANLDRAGISFDEAWELLKSELLMKRMMFIRVNSKVLKKVTPLVIRNYYDEWAPKNSADPQWHYHMISVRAKDPKKGSEAADAVYKLITEEGISLDEASSRMAAIPAYKHVQITVSAEFRHSPKEVAEENLSILSKLEKHQISEPVAQESRRDNSMVYRLFYVNDHLSGGAPPFGDVKEQLKYELLEKTTDEEMDSYIKKLRRHYNISDKILKESTPANFEPFSVR